MLYRTYTNCDVKYFGELIGNHPSEKLPNLIEEFKNYFILNDFILGSDEDTIREIREKILTEFFGEQGFKFLTYIDDEEDTSPLYEFEDVLYQLLLHERKEDILDMVNEYIQPDELGETLENLEEWTAGMYQLPYNELIRRLQYSPLNQPLIIYICPDNAEWRIYPILPRLLEKNPELRDVCIEENSLSSFSNIYFYIDK